MDSGNPAFFAFLKSSRDRSERALVILNKDRNNAQVGEIARIGYLFAGVISVEDVSPEARLNLAAGTPVYRLGPSGVSVFQMQVR